MERGMDFTAERTQATLGYSQAIHRRTIFYHPQTNGLKERLMKTIANMIVVYGDAEHNAWMSCFSVPLLTALH